MADIAIVSGSPQSLSGLERVLHYLGKQVEQKGYSIVHISVKDVNSNDLLFGNYKSKEIQQITSELDQAKGVIIGSPVYKSSYTGVLKALIDLLPQDILQDTPVLPLMTGGSASHLLAIEYTLKPLLATLKGQPIKGLYFQDSQLDKTKENPIIDKELLERTEKQLDYLLDKIKREAYLIEGLPW
ncbi:FMN reductase (NADPH) [Oceanobacillus piezotolerans]|uniref:FMN reductase (NADPH) n=1 Tax=Oceanobacillus piezotolerans TaxID=2448030 RepID=A0A498D411_9BACI|nr:NADPH-dependent FMN reductase [Oceanobacillus piezotolerans]RLL43605.1 FMN reductase (NADPH) [Oceanobacillus piezotolerans]